MASAHVGTAQDTENSTTTRKHLTARLIGGLGNKMWIYQSIHGIASYNHLIPTFNYDELSLLRSVFDLTAHNFTTHIEGKYLEGCLFDAGGKNTDVPSEH